MITLSSRLAARFATSAQQLLRAERFGLQSCYAGTNSLERLALDLELFNRATQLGAQTQSELGISNSSLFQRLSTR